MISTNWLIRSLKKQADILYNILVPCDFCSIWWFSVSLRLPLLWRVPLLLSLGIHLYGDVYLFTPGVSFTVSLLPVGKSSTAISNMAYINVRLHPFPFHDTIHFQIATEKKTWADNVRLCISRVYRTWKRLNVNIRLTFAVKYV